MAWFSATAIGLGDVDFAANDWSYASFPSGYIEINDAVHGPVVGDGKAVHAQLFGAGNKLRDSTHAIEQAVFSVDVKVRKFLGH